MAEEIEKELHEMTDDEIKSLFSVIIKDGLTIEDIRTHVIPVIEAHGDDMLDFDGKNCDDCSGWDGYDRRCSCGNRRVYWCPDGDGGYRPEAY